MGNIIEHLVLKYLVVPRAPKIKPTKKHIACIGDSITFGAGVRGKREETWEYFLEEQLGSEFQVLNYGISGRTLLKEGDYPYVAEKFFQIAQQIQADIYIIMLGTNDAKPFNWDENKFKVEYAEFVQRFKSLESHPDIYLMTPPQCYVDPELGKVGFEIEKDNVDGPIYQIVKEQAEKLNVNLIDLHEYTQDRNEWFADGVHPNREGNKSIADYIYNSLK